MLSTYAIVSLDKAKRYLRVDGDDNDKTIEILINSATRRTEDYCATLWYQREVTEYHIGDGRSIMYLYRNPLVSISKVSVNGEDISPDGYGIKYASGTLTRFWARGDVIVVTYTAGFVAPGGDPDIEIPQAVSGVLMCVASWYNNLTGATSESITGIGQVEYGVEIDLPQGVKAGLSSLRQRPLL